MDWQLHNALYYAFVLVSTIGYGDLNVQTEKGRLFAIVFSIVGMWLFNWFRCVCTVVAVFVMNQFQSVSQ